MGSIPGEGTRSHMLQVRVCMPPLRPGTTSKYKIKKKRICLQLRRPRFEPWVKKIHPLEQGMATHSSILTWRIPWTEKPGGLQSMGSQKQSDRTEQLRLSALLGTNRKAHNNVQLKNVTLFSSPAVAEAWVFPPSVSTGKLQGSGMHGGDLATAQTFWRPRRNEWKSNQQSPPWDG